MEIKSKTLCDYEIREVSHALYQHSAQRGKIMDYLENVEECFIIRSVFQMRHCLFYTKRLCENVITLVMQSVNTERAPFIHKRLSDTIINFFFHLQEKVTVEDTKKEVKTN